MEEKEAVPGSVPGMLMLYTDGSYQRLQPPSVPACPSFLHGESASADITLDPAHGTWARIFMPKQPSDHSNFKLPVVLYFHGSGFCVGSPSLSMFHSYCSRMALLSSCIWISLGYRLAPEHRLPAAYDDGFAALLWLLSQASLQVSGMPVQASTSSSDGVQDGGETLALHWLNRHADFSNTFLAGESAGATIAHFTAARASTRSDWKPLQMRGILLIQPGFFTEKPVMTTSNDTKSPATLSVSGLEFIHRVALPEDAEWGHPYVNPMHLQGLFKLSEIILPPVLVAVAEDDILRPAGEQYYNALKEAGKSDVEFFFSEHVGHGFHLLDPSSKGVIELLNRMTQFIEHHTS